MQHRNTPDTEFGLSPSQVLFGRPIRDFLPIQPGQFSPSEVWIDCREKRELAFRNRLFRGVERWSEHTKDLPPLEPGTRVLVQNQYGAGKVAKKWDRTGIVLENLGFNKYRVKIDGSGRITDRNRQFLRKFTPVTPTSPGPRPNCHDTQLNPTPTTPSYRQVEPEPGDIPVPSSPRVSLPQNVPDIRDSPTSPTFVTPPSSPNVEPNEPETSCNPPETPQLPRRSSRVSRLPERLSYDKNFKQVNQLKFTPG